MVLTRAIDAPTLAAAKRAFDAMMEMTESTSVQLKQRFVAEWRLQFLAGTAQFELKR